MTQCYTCKKGKLQKKKVPFGVYSVTVGLFQAQVCSVCGEKFFNEKASDQIEIAAKKAGVWGLESRTKVGQVGNSLDVKINKQLASFAKIEKGDPVRIYPDGKKRLIVEFD
jgi:YgiT-type zinc finger domain-containing protein